MIAKLKKKLVLQYTLIIVVLLACLSALAIAAIRYNNSKIIDNQKHTLINFLYK